MFGVYQFAGFYYADAPPQYTTNRPSIVPSTWDTSECPVRDCLAISGVANPNDFEIYNLQDALLFNTTSLSFVVDCPEGRTCVPGTYPRVITYPPGTFYLPDPVRGFPIVLSMEGCQSTVETVLPSTATAAEINAAAQAIFLQIGQQQAECDALEEDPGTPTGKQMNLSDIDSYVCVDATFSVVITGSPTVSPTTFNLINAPSWLTLAQNQTTAFVAGVPTAIGTYQFTITATTTNGYFGSKTYTINVVGIATASPLTNGTVGAAYSETLTAPTIPGTLTWSVASGALPDGILLNSSTGEISGVPTVDGVFSFTIGASN